MPSFNETESFFSLLFSSRSRCTRTFESQMVRRWSNAMRTVAFEATSRWASICSTSASLGKWCAAIGQCGKEGLRRSVAIDFLQILPSIVSISRVTSFSLLSLHRRSTWSSHRVWWWVLSNDLWKILGRSLICFNQKLIIGRSLKEPLIALWTSQNWGLPVWPLLGFFYWPTTKIFLDH